MVLAGCGVSAALAAVILPASALTLSSATALPGGSLSRDAVLPLPSTTPLPTLPLPTPSVPVSVPPVLPTPTLPPASPPALPTPSLPVTVAFLDLDGLKRINDGRGHSAGDQLLKGLASGLRGGLRGQDLVLRYGGDEFVCVLPDTALEAAKAKLQEIQAELAAGGVAFSFGLAQFERNDDVVSLLGRADGELYKAKARPRLVTRPEDKTRPAFA